MKVLSVDVGIRTCGYVICEVKNLDIILIKEGQIKPVPEQSLPQKLNYIFEQLQKEANMYNLQAIIVEKLYSHYRHPTTLGVLAQVRGVIALFAYQRKIDFFEYSTTRARKAFLGKGNADSNRVKKMAESLIGKELKSIHTADAFSLVSAFSHAEKLRKMRADIFYPCASIL